MELWASFQWRSLLKKPIDGQTLPDIPWPVSHCQLGVSLLVHMLNCDSTWCLSVKGPLCILVCGCLYGLVASLLPSGREFKSRHARGFVFCFFSTQLWLGFLGVFFLRMWQWSFTQNIICFLISLIDQAISMEPHTLGWYFTRMKFCACRLYYGRKAKVLTWITSLASSAQTVNDLSSCLLNNVYTLFPFTLSCHCALH